MEKQYPYFVEYDPNGEFCKVFENEEGNQEHCIPTGREKRNSPNPGDWWLEYEDSLGGLHYGR